MAKPIKLALLIAAIACATSPAWAQMSAPPIISALPNVAGMTAGNAAGVLQYCIKNNLVSSVSADAVLDGLNKKPDISKSSDFSAGQAGQILTGQGKPFSMGQAPGYLQSQACDMVLKRAKNLM